MAHRSQFTAARRDRLTAASVWVVVPAYNEATYLSRVLKKITAVTKHVIVVDDGSRDKTATIARRFTDQVLVHAVNLGKGAAMKTGCDWAFTQLGAKAVVLLDGDDQHDPRLLPEFVQLLGGKARLVCGVRVLSQMPLLRRVGNETASILIWLLFGQYIKDIPSGYKALTKKAYQQLRWQSSGYEVEMEIAARAARSRIPVSAVNIPTIYHDTNKGMTMLDVLKMISQVFSWRITI